MPTEPTARPSLDALPEAPSRRNPTTFRELADAFLAALVIFGGQLNVLVGWMLSTATEVFDNATIAVTKAGEASDSAGVASGAEAQVLLALATAQEGYIDASEAALGAGLQVADDGLGNRIIILASGQRGSVQTDLVGTAVSLNLGQYQIFPILLTGTTTFEFDLDGFGSMVGTEITFMVEIEQGGTAYGVDWTNGATQVIKSDRDTLPELPIANEKAQFIISSIDAGATWTIARTMRFSA